MASTVNWLQFYRSMLTIRRFEERVSQLYADGELPGFVHLYIGEEAVAVGVCSVLNRDDYITSTHRGHGHLIAKGGDIKRMMAELYGKKTGYCKGKGGSMHIADMDIGILGANGIVAGGLPIAVGAGYSIKLRSSKQVAVAFFGDGASNEGAFHEAMNMASAWNLPVIFVCENNQYGVGTRLSRVTRLMDISKRALAYGMESSVVDGNDVLSVHESTAAAVQRARDDRGPTLIVAKTFRQRGHFEGENTSYMDADEMQHWLEKDPIHLFGALLKDRGIVDSKSLEQVDREIRRSLEEAVLYARESDFPLPEEALDDLFYEKGGQTR